MDALLLKKLFPNLEEGLYNEIVKHGTIKEVKAGETLLKVGQTIRSTMLIIDGLVKLYREDDEGKEFFIYHLMPGRLVLFQWYVQQSMKQVRYWLRH